MYNEPVVNLNLGNNNDTLHNKLTQSNYGDNKQMQHAHIPYVRLSLDNEYFIQAMKPNVNNISSNNNNILPNNINPNINNKAIMNNQQYSNSEINNDDINILNKQVWEINKGKGV